MLNKRVIIILVILPIFLSCEQSNDPEIEQNNVEPEKVKYYPSLGSKRYYTVEEYVANQGYEIERHSIKTEDGYLLIYHRILNSPKYRSKEGDKKIPVLLQHGLLSCSGAFMAHDNSLTYLLADAGFDVWLGNARGNLYSRKHSRMDPDTDDKYWEFSFHEMGKYDLPAGIDYIRRNTGFNKLYYVGFSMGTTMYFVMGATRSEYMDKIEAMIALAPVVRPKNMRLAKKKVLFFFVRMLFKVLTFFGFDEMFPYSQRRVHYTEIFCNPNCKKPSRICVKLLSLLLSQTPEFDPTLRLRSFLYFPSGTSVRTQDHFLQMAYAGRFQQYDFGSSGNKKHYDGSPTPPQYDLKKVTSPIFLVWGEHDSLSVKEDIEWLIEELPTKPLVMEAKCNQFSHQDFMYGKNVAELLHYHIIKHIYGQQSEKEIYSNNEEK